MQIVISMLIAFIHILSIAMISPMGGSARKVGSEPSHVVPVHVAAQGSTFGGGVATSALDCSWTQIPDNSLLGLQCVELPPDVPALCVAG